MTLEFSNIQMQTTNPFPCIAIDPEFRAKSAFVVSDSSLLSVTENPLLWQTSFPQGEDPNMPYVTLKSAFFKRTRACFTGLTTSFWKQCTQSGEKGTAHDCIEFRCLKPLNLGTYASYFTCLWKPMSTEASFGAGTTRKLCLPSFVLHKHTIFLHVISWI